MRFRFVLAFVLIPVALAAQNAPLTGTLLKSTSSSIASLCVGCPLGSTTPVANSSAKVASVTFQQLSAPMVTTDKLYNVSGVLNWSAGFTPTYTQYATSISPVANGTTYRGAVTGLTMLGVAGSTYDWSVYNPSGAAALLANPTGTTNIMVPSGSFGFGSTVALMNTVPTVTSGFGTSNTITGKAYGFTINVGTSSSNTGVVNFNATHSNPPACVASGIDTVHVTTVLDVTTTTVTLFSGTVGWDDGTLIRVICLGY